MNTISRFDRLAAQLRAQLKRRAQDSSLPPRPSGAPAVQRDSRVQAVSALKAAGVKDENVLVRCLIQGVLVNEFGDGLVNSAPFQQMVGSVVTALADDPQAWAMCRACIEEA